MGTFDGIQIGSTGLAAQRRGVEVAGQNIANVNTVGYTRQRVEIVPDSGPVTPAIHSTWSGTGLGVRSHEVLRMRDAFIDRRVREELTTRGELAESQHTLAAIERVFGEPGDNGVSALLADFYASWDDLANRPDDIAARTQVAEHGRSLTIGLNDLRAAVQRVADDAVVRLDGLVGEVNAMAAEVAALQDTILSAVASGNPANELLDQRDALLEKLAERVGGTTHAEDDGTVTLFVGGIALVRGNRANPLELVDVAGTAVVQWTADGRPADVGGRAAGMLEAVNETVPRYVAELDTIAADLAATVNAVHATGFDRNGVAGGPFFVTGPGGIAVNPAILADPQLIAAASAPGTLDGSVALAIAGLEGTDDGYRDLVVRLGVEAQAANKRLSLQNDVVSRVRAEEQAAHGVNLDEELADLVRFQRAYEASSRFISAVDELLNVLVNATGRVGR